MEPHIQYAKASDGVNVAFWTSGNGMPFVHLSPGFPFTHLQLEWMMPGWEEWCSGLASVSKLVRLDHRGCGLSGGYLGDLSIDGMVEDVEAVADRLSLDQFVLAGVFHTGPAAIAYAARHPERVSRLILWCAYAQASEVRSAAAESLHALLDKDWDVFTQTCAHVLFGWSREEALVFSAFAGEALSQADARTAFERIDQFDVSRLLCKVMTPTLVVQRRQFPMSSVEVAKNLASNIPDARLVTLDGTSLAPWIGDANLAKRSVMEFLMEQLPGTADTETTVVGPLRTVLFTDLVGHTEMMSRLGDERGRDVLREHERITREVLKANGGTEVKTMGDGFMASFGSVTKAVECAIALQRAYAEREGEPLSVRVGLNAGEPIEEDGPDGRSDLFGATVILASRIAAKAEGGEILVADTVRGLCSGKGFLFADRGEFVAKGFEEPVRVYEVSWRS